jgi:hypothetical protein
MILLCTQNKTCTQFMVLILLSIEKRIFACWFGTTSVPFDLVSELNPTYICYFFHNCTDFLHSTHQISCPFSLAQVVRQFIQRIRPSPRPFVTFRNKLISYDDLLDPRPTPKLEDHPLSAVRYIFAANLHTWWPSPPSAT